MQFIMEWYDFPFKWEQMCVQETHAVPTFVPKRQCYDPRPNQCPFLIPFRSFFGSVLPANADDASSDKLLNLGPDVGVPHVLGQSRRVGLSLLEDGLHDRIGHDTHDLNANMLVYVANSEFGITI